MTERTKGPRRRRLIAVIVIVAAAGVAVAYRAVSEVRPDPVPVTRRTFDFDVAWKCLTCGYTVTRKAGVGPQTCPKCGKESMYASIKWSCPQHGAFDVAFQYDADGKPVQVRIGQQEWTDALNEYGGWNIDCPRCGAPMNPAQ